MPFSPLPDFLLEKIHRLSTVPGSMVLDLGCGDGSLGGIITPMGVRVIGLDSVSPGLGSAAQLVGDALAIPLLPGRVDLVIAGNLFRHLLVSDPNAGFMANWGALLKPGGCLILLEDDSRSESPAVLNYIELQDFLVKITEGRRGKLLGLEEFQKMLPRFPLSGSWVTGLQNNCWPADPEVVVSLLLGQGAEPQGEAARLIASIRSHGIKYGDYWWASWERHRDEF